MLELERDGNDGTSEEISPWLKFQTSAWASKEGIGERGLGRAAYWLQGFRRSRIRAEGQATINAARKWIEPCFIAAGRWLVRSRDLLIH